MTITALSLVLVSVQAQDPTVKKLQEESAKAIAKNPADTLPAKWRKGGMYNLNLAQGSLKNWAAGGDEFSLTISSILNLFAFYKEGKHSWDNTFDLNFGYVRTTSLGSRKNDDRIDLLSKYGYAIAPKWNLAGLFNFRSQIAKGYTYTDNIKTLSSAFLSPAYILVSPGIDYKPNNHFSVFLSPATARWIIVRDDTLSAKGLYGVEPGKKSELEVGAFLTANYIKELNRVVAYKGRLDLFSNYRNNPKNVDVFFTNVFAVRLSRALAATWNIDIIYDDDIRIFGKDKTSPATQVKSLIGAGLQVKF
jgi:hypothetical protein